MILKALYDYYQRCDGLAPYGREKKEISFLIVIDKDGNFERLEDKRENENSSQRFLVARSADRTSNVEPNFLWDNLEYVWGTESKKNAKFEAFKERVNDACSWYPNKNSIIAVKKFYEKGRDYIEEQLKADPLWKEIKTSNLSFKVLGEDQLPAEESDLLEKYIEIKDSKYTVVGICLVTGMKLKLAPTMFYTTIPHGKAKAKLVSFQENSGFDSYGKTKGYNASISLKAEFACTTALDQLTGKGSENKFNVGDRTYVFWASSNSDASRKLEQSIFALMGAPVDDNPNRNIEAVKQVFMDIYSGIKPNKEKDRFYILGLAPNSARIAVVYWYEQSVEEFAKHILKHFEDMEIVDSRPDDKKFPYVGVRQMTASITRGGKSSDVQPNLPEAIIKSIMQETPYPITLFSACIRRIKAEQDAERKAVQKAVQENNIYEVRRKQKTRAAILKAYLNRINDNNNQKLKVMLDKENMNQGYLCGRLFATLEYIQERANNIHTIRERYMNAASATPAAVFSTILNLSNHHIEKLEKGAQIFFEGLKGEIMQKIAANGFPAHLDLNDQGRFFVGYYHQRQEFYKKNETSENEE
jgi:CRISPR-associated protein Csd1